MGWHVAWLDKKTFDIISPLWWESTGRESIPLSKDELCKWCLFVNLNNWPSNWVTDHLRPYARRHHGNYTETEMSFDDTFVTACIASCQNDKMLCNQWRKYRQMTLERTLTGSGRHAVWCPWRRCLCRKLLLSISQSREFGAWDVLIVIVRPRTPLSPPFWKQVMNK